MRPEIITSSALNLTMNFNDELNEKRHSFSSSITAFFQDNSALGFSDLKKDDYEHEHIKTGPLSSKDRPARRGSVIPALLYMKPIREKAIKRNVEGNDYSSRL